MIDKISRRERNMLILGIIGLLLIVIQLLCCSYRPPEGLIRYRQLSFLDYTIVDSTKLKNVSATTCTGLVIAYNDHLKTYIAVAVCDLNRSLWLNTANTNVPYLLKHEQGHFDITQYCALRLNLEMKGLDTATQRVLYDQTVEIWEQIEDQYDLETDHSRDTANQKIWNTAINKLLTK